MSFAAETLPKAIFSRCLIPFQEAFPSVLPFFRHGTEQVSLMLEHHVIPVGRSKEPVERLVPTRL